MAGWWGCSGGGFSPFAAVELVVVTAPESVLLQGKILHTAFPLKRLLVEVAKMPTFFLCMEGHLQFFFYGTETPTDGGKHLHFLFLGILSGLT